MKIPDNIDEIDTTKKDYAPIPDGKYVGTIVDADERNATGGKHYINLQIAITSGPHARRRVFDKIFTDGGGVKRFKKICQLLGIELKGGANLDVSVFKGKLIEIDVVTEVYNGKADNRVTYEGYKLLGQSEPSQAGGADADADLEDIPF